MLFLVFMILAAVLFIIDFVMSMSTNPQHRLWVAGLASMAIAFVVSNWP